MLRYICTTSVKVLTRFRLIQTMCGIFLTFPDDIVDREMPGMKRNTVPQGLNQIVFVP